MEKNLMINTGITFLLKDRDNITDKYERVIVNSGVAVLSSDMNARLAEKGITLNVGRIYVQDIGEDILRVPGGVRIGAGLDYKGAYILAEGDAVILPGGERSLETAEGMIGSGKIFYPASMDMAALLHVQGDLVAYPDDAQVMLGNRTLEGILGEAEEGRKHVQVSGCVTALEARDFDAATQKGLHIGCPALFTYEGLYERFRQLFTCARATTAPDGHTVVAEDLTLSSAEALLYGPKIYARGDLTLVAGGLEGIEGIIVEKCANIPTDMVREFKAVGKAESYLLYEGSLRKVNGVELISHDYLQSVLRTGGKLSLFVNGTLLFSDDVVAEDIEAVAMLGYNGAVIAPAGAAGALGAKAKTANGFFGDPTAIQAYTGLSREEIMKQFLGGEGDGSIINSATYILA